jgi:amidase
MSFFNPSAGPLANDVHALDLLCRSVMSVRPALYDTDALDVPWRDLSKSPNTEKLRIGVVSEDPSFPLHPPVKRALADAVSLLEAQGHYIHKINASSAHVANALALAFAFFGLDDTPPQHVAASGEPLVPSVKQSMGAFHDFKCDFLDDCAHLEGIKRVAALNVKRHKIAEDWRRIWKEQKLDVVIGPSAQNTAVPHDTYGLPPYTLFLNVLDVSL